MSEEQKTFDSNEQKTFDPLLIFRNFIEEYNLFKNKADDYKDKGEIEGALINYKLAANSLHHALLLKDTESDLKTFIKSDEKLKEWCTDACTRIEELLRELLSHISPLQDELKRRKLAQGGKNDDLGNCDDIFSKQIVLEGKDCIFFDDVIGLESVKEKLFNGFIYPSIYKNLFPNTAKGILFYGPPGTGKSFLAKAAANELDRPIDDPYMHVLYFAPEGGDLKGKYVGETEKNIQKFFKCASEAATKCETDLNDNETDERKKRHHVISILFLDEVDAIAGDRLEDSSGMMSLSVNALLQAIDGMGSKSNVSVLAATNLPWSLDSAFLRRFESKVLIGLPSATDISLLLKYNINKYLEKLGEFMNPTPKNKDRKTKKTKIECVKAEGKCDRKIGQKEDLIMSYKEFMPNLTTSGIEALALTMHNKSYSPSDISKVCSSVFRIVGDRARKNNTFYKMNYNTFLEDTNSNSKGINKEFYMSTLSLTNLIKDSEQKRKDIENNLLLIKPLTSKDYKSITVGNITFINKSELAVETFLNDPYVDTFYIKNPNENDKTLQVLFKIEIGFQFMDGTTDTKEFYIISSINKRKLEDGVFSWLGSYVPFTHKKTVIEKNREKREKEIKLSSYEELINNMTVLLYKPKNSNSNEFYVSDNVFDNDFKNSLKNRQFVNVNDDYKKSFHDYSIESTGKYDLGDRPLFLSEKISPVFIYAKTDSKRDYVINKDAFFTFDIRDSDFEDETLRTAGSVKKSEYAELKEYEKDPSTYKPKSKQK
jgi:SpoVK/Ycf46/Vps4 family AAA+-type ATPase